MPNSRTIAPTSTALVLLLSCNCILPTKAFTADDDDDDAYSYDHEITSNLNMTCASADPSVFTSPACYTVMSFIGTEYLSGTVNAIFENYEYQFYKQELEGGPVDASVDYQIGRAVSIYYYYGDAHDCSISIGNFETCDCSPCDMDADGLRSTTFRIDCSRIDGGIDASDTCVELAPYPQIYDPHLGKDFDDFTFPIDDPIDDDYDYIPPSRLGSLFCRFGGRVDKISAFLKSGLPSFRRGKRNH